MLKHQNNAFLKLPNDVLLYSMQYLSIDDLLRLSRVCQRLRLVIRNDQFWQTKFHQHFGAQLIDEHNSNWFTRFGAQTLEHYPEMSNDKRKMFYYIIEKDWVELKKLVTSKKITIYDFVTIRDKKGLNPLDYLHKNKAQVILDFLFSHALNYFVRNSKINHLRTDSIEWCATHWAVATNQHEDDIIAYLNHLTSNLTNVDNFNKLFKKLSPIHIAAEYGLDTIFEALRRYGCNVDCRTMRINGNIDERLSPLHLAARKGHLNIVATLLKSGVNVGSLATEQGLSKMHFSNGNIKAIHYAAANQHIDTVKILLAHGASAFDEDDFFNSPLQYTAARGYDDVFKLLVEQEPGSMNITSSLNRALFCAVDKKCYRFIQPLLAKGARSDWKSMSSHYNYSGRTAIDLAIEHQSEEALRVLLGEMSNHAISTNYKPASYSSPCFLIFCIPGMILLGLPGMWLGLYLANILKIDNSFAIFLFAIIPILLGALIGSLIGYAIGKQMEKNVAQEAQSFIGSVTSPVVTDQENPIEEADDNDEIANREAQRLLSNQSSDRTLMHSLPVQSVRAYLPLTFLRNTNIQQEEPEDLERGLIIDEDPATVVENHRGLLVAKQQTLIGAGPGNIAPRAVHFPPVPQHEPVPAAARVQPKSSEQSQRLTTG